MKWVEAAGFDFSNMAPAEMILARHVEYLRADAKLKKLFGGSTEDPLKIRCCPIGRALELGGAPTLFATLPEFDRQPGPGLFSESVTIRDVIRFHSSSPTGDEPLWEPGLATVASHIIGVVTATDGGANQLNLSATPAGVPLAQTIHLARRVDLTSIGLEQLKDVGTGEGLNLFDLYMDFKYDTALRTGAPRNWALVTVEGDEV